MIVGGLLKKGLTIAVNFLGTPLGIKCAIGAIALSLVGWRFMVYRANLIDTHERIGRVTGFKEAESTLKKGWTEQESRYKAQLDALARQGETCELEVQRAAAQAAAYQKQLVARKADFERQLAEREALNAEERRKLVDSLTDDELDDAIRNQLAKNRKAPIQ
jgi:hypothetical protein